VSIPLATTTVTVRRSDQDGTIDDLDGLTFTDYRTGVRAVIAYPGGAEIVGDGTSSVVGVRLVCDPVDLTHTDRVVDETTGLEYEVQWLAQRVGLGLDHVTAGLQLVTDRAAL